MKCIHLSKQNQSNNGTCFIGSSSHNNIQLKETAVNSAEPSSMDSMQSTTSTLSAGTQMSSLTSTNERARDLAICAVILDEWLKELSAITQEQSIAMLTEWLEK